MRKNKRLLVAGFVLGLNGVNANATLVTEGLGVYDTAIDATWTQDANLLGTLETTYGYSVIVDAVIAADPVISDTPNTLDTPANSGAYNLTASDFKSGGLVDWYAAKAFVAYLNGIAYDTSTQWSLPAADTSCLGYNCTGSQLGELFYTGLGGVSGKPMPSGPFSNVQSQVYWTANESAAAPTNAWDFGSYIGYQSTNAKGSSDMFYAWAVSPGNAAATVPTPAAAWLFGTGILGFLGLRHRRGIG
ncbi:MAG: hypothetical protein PHW13_06885 [Methylococcales bacterium]|nr:hypothetical protein [Methylococcales bacterium]